MEDKEKENEGEDKPAEPDVELFGSFDSMGLNEWLLRGVYAYGFEQPSAIQQRAIVPLVRGSDVLVQSHSGTGKTSTWGIGVLSHIDATIGQVQALILCPTRELAIASTRV